MYINVNKSGHMKSLIYSLTIGLKPKLLLLSKDMLQIGTMLSSKVKTHL